MPRRPVRPIQRRIDGSLLTGREMEHLILGFEILDEKEAPFNSDKQRRRCWKKHRNHILALQGQKAQGESFGLSSGVYFDFFTRPAAWWDYDTPEPRRLLKGDPADALPEHGYLKGVPVNHRSFEARQEKKYESEVEYLQRHGFLTDTEKEVLKKKGEAKCRQREGLKNPRPQRKGWSSSKGNSRNSESRKTA